MELGAFGGGGHHMASFLRNGRGPVGREAVVKAGAPSDGLTDTEHASALPTNWSTRDTRVKRSVRQTEASPKSGPTIYLKAFDEQPLFY